MIEVSRIELGNSMWSDNRGWGVNPIKATHLPNRDLGNLHISSIRPGRIRGNHYHDVGTEWLLIFGGPARFTWRLSGEDPRNEEIVSSEPHLYEIPPHFQHAIMNTSNADIFVVSFSDVPERNTIPCNSLFPE
jgi:UDP-2-acetamido-2,6-beta-L-arabino-hexul-4-ose reductase